MSTLEEQVAAIRPGDKVTARFEDGDGHEYTVSGTVSQGARSESLVIGYVYLRTSKTDQPDVALRAVESHEPAEPPVPPEPKYGDLIVVNGDGHFYIPNDDGSWIDDGGNITAWPSIANGVDAPVVFRPEPSPERIEELVREHAQNVAGQWTEQGLRHFLTGFAARLLGSES